MDAAANMNQTSVQYMSNNFNSFNTVNNIGATDERPQILAWISPLESWKRHHDVSNIRVKGVGEWVLETAEFQAWRDGGDEGLVDKTLFGCGIPGAGKTFTCSLVIDSLCNSTANSNVGVACLYCDYREQKEQVPVTMIGGLLRQFVSGLTEIPEDIIKAFKEAKGDIGGRALQLDKMMEIFPQVLSTMEKAFISIDALDEFPIKHRVEFLKCLKKIVERSPNTRLFLTGRPHIRSQLDKHLTGSAGIINIQPDQGDIRTYISNKLDTDPDDDVMDNNLRSEIIEKISKDHSEIFLLVTLHIDTILGEVTISGRRSKLYQVAGGLRDAYSATVERIRGQGSAKARLGIGALMWISLAERPLSVDELRHALAVEVGSKDLDPGSVPSIETLLASCLGLVTVDRETSTLRLIHETLQEYLRTHPDLFSSPHATIAEACLSYLNFQSVRALAVTADSRFLSKHPLLSYASRHWGNHARKELTGSVETLALEILSQAPEHIAGGFVIISWIRAWEPEYRQGFSGLHYAAYFGIPRLVGTLLAMGIYNLNQRDCLGCTPLIWASRCGHGVVVKMLLDQNGVNPNIRDYYLQSALIWAAGNGHEGATKELVAHADTDINSRSSFHRAALSLAAENGYQRVVEILLTRGDIRPDSMDRFGRTPLLLAASNGHEDVVKTLLAWADVDPRQRDKYNHSPIEIALRNGHTGVVKLLLSRMNSDNQLLHPPHQP